MQGDAYPGLEELIADTGVTKKQLDSECDDAHFVLITKHIFNYQEYGPLLGVPDQRIKAIEQNMHFRSDAKLITAEVFREWHRNENNTCNILCPC